MKKYITAPIGSAIIVPGFGQVLNGQIKKGLILMSLVFVIFIAGVIKLTQIILTLLPELESGKIKMEEIHAKINFTDYSILTIVIVIFLIIWLYSIVDACINGIKIERERKQK